MKTADEILEDYIKVKRLSLFQYDAVIKAMKAYASQAIERCAEVAFIKKNRIGNTGASVNLVDKQSILKVKNELA